MGNVIPFKNIETRKETQTEVLTSSQTTANQSIARVHPLAAVMGDVYLGQRVTVAPGVSIHGNEGKPIWIGNDVKVQDCVVLYASPTQYHDELIEELVVEVDGKFYGIYIDEGVCLAPQCQIQAPASVGSDTFIGMQTLVFRATVGKNCIIEPKALVMGVEIGDSRYVAPGAIVNSQDAADNLPLIDQDNPLKDLSRGTVDTGYKKQEIRSEGKNLNCPAKITSKSQVYS
ncbi:MAG: hypothetical protein QNJ70_11355 [Xenococcaceae cyanobacterium MO_207.B15]|nr:hypothetical protein [Xenococcaceae cyanobacterium MO_207.B15]